jgi:hypothetical protein
MHPMKDWIDISDHQEEKSQGKEIHEQVTTILGDLTGSESKMVAIRKIEEWYIKSIFHTYS